MSEKSVQGSYLRPIPLLHLATLSSFAFAQPLFQLLSRNAEFLVIRGSAVVDVLALVGLLVLVAPLPSLLVAWLASRIGGKTEALVHGSLIAGFGFLIALQAGKALGPERWRGALAMAAALAAGSLFVWLRSRFHLLRSFLTLLAPAILIFPSVFLLDPDIRRATFGGGAAKLHQTRPKAVSSADRPPVIFLVFDELSLTSILDADRQIDAGRLPHLAAFARRATWVENAVTASDVTEIAIPALLSGKLPRPGQLPGLQDHPDNLFTLLGGSYAVWAEEPITRLCPRRINRLTGNPPGLRTRIRSLVSDLAVVWLHLTVPPPWDDRLPRISNAWRGFAAAWRSTAEDGGGPESDGSDQASERKRAQEEAQARIFQRAVQALGEGHRDRSFRDFLAAFNPEEGRALYFGHVLLPHLPWEYLPSGRRYSTLKDRVPGLHREMWVADPWPAAQAHQRFLLQVGFLDRLLGELFERLEELDLFDRSLIVLVADHGVSFRPGDSRRLLTETNAPDLLPVPLLIKAPFQREGRVIEEAVSTVDVLPTVVDILGIDPPWPMDGRSIFADGAAPACAREIKVLSKHRGERVIDPSIHETKYRTLERRLKMTAAPGGGDPLYRIGPHPGLVGRPVEGLQIAAGGAGEIEVRLDGADRFIDVDLAVALVPVFLNGVVEDQDEPPFRDLAVAVNGVVAATTRALSGPGGRLRFGAMIPEESLVAGRNRVEFFLIEEGDGGPRLVAVEGGEDSVYGLAAGSAAGDGAILVDGEPYELVAAPWGWIDKTLLDGEGLSVAGWAVDEENLTPPEQVVVFYDGRPVYSGATSVSRADLVKKYGAPAVLESGFRFEILAHRVPEIERHGLRVFALSKDGKASELGFLHRRLEAPIEGREEILATNGRVFEVRPGELQIWVDSAETDAEGLKIGGWAVDPRSREPVERLVIFRGRDFYAHFPAREARLDVADFLAAPHLTHTGFNLRLGPEGAAALEAGRLRFFAVSSQGVASEFLPRPSGRD